MNGVLVFADHMRGQDMACSGNRQVVAPNFDRMAAAGTLFTPGLHQLAGLHVGAGQPRLAPVPWIVCR